MKKCTIIITNGPLAHISSFIPAYLFFFLFPFLLQDTHLSVLISIHGHPFQVRDLEGENEAEQRRVREAVAFQRKAERLFKELQTQSEEERKQLTEMQTINDQLTIRCKNYKRQVDEAVSEIILIQFPLTVSTEHLTLYDRQCTIALLIGILKQCKRPCSVTTVGF